MTSCDVAIVGAGAAGLATGIFAARANPALSIVVLEGARRPGAKILISGGGRCNVTNSVVDEADFWGGRRTVVRRILRAFGPGETAAFFRELDVPLHEEADGKLFPDSNRARDVLDALLRALAAAGVPLRLNCRVAAAGRVGDRFRLATTQGEVTADCLVLATGGQSVPRTGSDGAGYRFAEEFGHTLVPTTPGLAPLVLERGSIDHAALAGVAQEVELSVWVEGAVAQRLRGPLLWTHFGVSGPVALNASRHWERAKLQGQPVAITVSFLPGAAFDEVDARLAALQRSRPAASLRSALSSLVPAAVAQELVRHLALDPALRLAHLSRGDRRSIAGALSGWPLAIIGTRGYNYAEVTAGGVTLTEIDPATMRSRRCPGLYLVGEIVDVDGRIGGFNFQWAWASAFVAGRSIGRTIGAGRMPAPDECASGL